MDLTAEQKNLVSEAWKIMKKNMSDLSHHFFTTIHKNGPAALGMFSFIENKDVAPRRSGNLEKHAKEIFELIYELAVDAKTSKKLDIKKLGFNTLKKGVNKDHFEVVKKALLSTVKEAMGDNWSEEMGNAWVVAYDNLAAAINAKMKKEAEASSSG